jgi:hypothetical protein
MKVYLDKRNYIDIKVSDKEDSVVMAIKAKKDDKNAVLLTVHLTDEQVEKIISHLSTSKAKIKYE